MRIHGKGSPATHEISFILGLEHSIYRIPASLYHLLLLFTVYCQLCHLLEEQVGEEYFLHFEYFLTDMHRGGKVIPGWVLGYET